MCLSVLMVKLVEFSDMFYVAERIEEIKDDSEKVESPFSEMGKIVV